MRKPLSVDGEAVPGGEQAPTQEGHHAALPLTCPLCERETSQTVFINKTTGGLVYPPCKVHGELVCFGGTSARMRVCVYLCVCVEHNNELATAT